jgi:hypothetical protein
MRAGPVLALLLVLAGCGVFHRAPPPWSRPNPAAASPATPSSKDVADIAARETAAAPAAENAVTSAPLPSAPARPPEPAPVVAVPPPTPPPPPAPAPLAVPPPAAPVSPPTAPAPPRATAPPPPSPPLTASLPPAEVRRLRDDAQRGIEEAERLLRQLERRPFAPKDFETLQLAQSLVEQARKALGGEEYERAANLAAKARTLADDLNIKR